MKFLISLFFFAAAGWAQIRSYPAPTPNIEQTLNGIQVSAVLPASCDPLVADLVWRTTSPIGLYQCSATDTWEKFGTLSLPNFSFQVPKSLRIGSGALDESWNLYSAGANSRNRFEGSVGIGPDFTDRYSINFDYAVSSYKSSLVEITEVSDSGTQGVYTMRTPTYLSSTLTGGSNTTLAFTPLMVAALTGSSHTGNIGWLTGLTAYADHYGSGTVKNVIGMDAGGMWESATDANASVWGVSAWVTQYGGTTKVNVGTETSASVFGGHTGALIGIQASAVAGGASASADKAYSVYVKEPTASGGATITEAWNIYSAGTASKNYFEGQVSQGVTSGTYEDVWGTYDIRHASTWSSYRANVIRQLINTKPGGTAGGVVSGIDHLMVVTAPANSGNWQFDGDWANSIWLSGIGSNLTIDLKSARPLEHVMAGEFYLADSSAAGTTSLAGIRTSVSLVNPEGFAATLWGDRVVLDIYGSVTNTYGVESRLYLEEGATIANAYVIKATIGDYGDPTITNLYGVHIDNTAGHATNAWNIYSAGATSKNKFEGALYLGEATPGENELDSIVLSKTYTTNALPGDYDVVNGIRNYNLYQTSGTKPIYGAGVKSRVDLTGSADVYSDGGVVGGVFDAYVRDTVKLEYMQGVTGSTSLRNTSEVHDLAGLRSFVDLANASKANDARGVDVLVATRDTAAITKARGVYVQMSGVMPEDTYAIYTVGNSIKSKFEGEVQAKTITLNPDAVARPACEASAKGSFWYVAGANDVKDTVEVCAKDASNAWAWRTIY
jgi:hypothetical protein